MTNTTVSSRLDRSRRAPRRRRARLAAVAMFGAMLGSSGPGHAGDHFEAPALFEDPAADIADFYAWHQDGNLVAIVTFGGYGLPGFAAVWDRDVLYGVHIDVDGDTIADFEIWARAGQDTADNYGIEVSGIPGESAPIVGPVEMELVGEQARVWGGLRDDPFFWDREGFVETLGTGTLAFDSSRDFAYSKNTTAVVIEFPLAALGAAGPISVWSSARRLP